MNNTSGVVYKADTYSRLSDDDADKEADEGFIQPKHFNKNTQSS